MLTWMPYCLPSSTALSMCRSGSSRMSDQSSRLPHTQYASGRRAKSKPHSAIASKSASSYAGPSYGWPGQPKRPCRLNPRQRGMRGAVMSSSAASAFGAQPRRAAPTTARSLNELPSLHVRLSSPPTEGAERAAYAATAGPNQDASAPASWSVRPRNAA